MRVFILIVVLTISLSVRVVGQLKYEAEERISRKEIPQRMLEYMDECCEDLKIKWYKEQQLDSYSYEAKFKKLGRSYSVEFNKEGLIEDVEILIAKDDIPEGVMLRMNTYLDQKFDQYRIEKTQLQYTGEEDDLEDLLEDEELDEELKLRYEVVIMAKKDREVGRWELLFDDQGAKISVLKVVFRNQDNLNY